MKTKMILLGCVCVALNVCADEGDSWFSGPRGRVGLQGEVGPQGPAGKAGPQGLRGETGSVGPQGKVGPQGPQGLQGRTGAQGASGLQGMAGPQGIQGVTGLQGVTGGAVVSLYSASDQSLSSGDVVFFEGLSAASSLVYDVSGASTSGQVLFLKGGVYNISWGVEGRLTPPFSNPAPAWALALYLDGVPIPGSCFSGFTSSSGKSATFVGGRLAVAVSAGQVLTLQSVSNQSISLSATTVGVFVPTVSASIVIESE